MNVDAHLLIDLIDAAMSADYTRVRRVGNRLAKQLAESKDLDGAKAIQSLLRQRAMPLQASGYSEALPRDAGSRLPLIEEGQWPTGPVLLGEQEGRSVNRFLEDAQNIALLERKGIATRLGLLLSGSPGTGKSMLAGQIASSLNRPIYTARLDSVISSRLGETAKNIRNVFDFIPQRKAVLFLDELDAVAKIRDDRHELGELKRVVNTVIQGLDSLSNDVIVIGATNHPHLLDPAIWRRFPYKIELCAPEDDVRNAMWIHFLFEDRRESINEARILSRLSNGLTGADIESISLGARRRAVLDDSKLMLPQIISAIISSKPGAPGLVHDGDLSLVERKRLASYLREQLNMTVTDVAKCIGVSRQMVHRYLSPNEVEHAK